MGKFIQQTKEWFSNVVSSHPDPVPFFLLLLSVKHLQEQLVLLKGNGSKITKSYFDDAALRARSVTSRAFRVGLLKGLLCSLGTLGCWG